jgi:hypothetical protein
MEFIWLFPRALLDRPDMGRHHDLGCRKLARQKSQCAQVLASGIMPRFANPEKPEYHGICDGTDPGK